MAQLRLLSSWRPLFIRLRLKLHILCLNFFPLLDFLLDFINTRQEESFQFVPIGCEIGLLRLKLLIQSPFLIQLGHSNIQLRLKVINLDFHVIVFFNDLLSFIWQII